MRREFSLLNRKMKLGPDWTQAYESKWQSIIPPKQYSNCRSLVEQVAQLPEEIQHEIIYKYLFSSIRIGVGEYGLKPWCAFTGTSAGVMTPIISWSDITQMLIDWNTVEMFMMALLYTKSLHRFKSGATESMQGVAFCLYAKQETPLMLNWDQKNFLLGCRLAAYIETYANNIGRVRKFYGIRIDHFGSMDYSPKYYDIGLGLVANWVHRTKINRQDPRIQSTDPAIMLNVNRDFVEYEPYTRERTLSSRIVETMLSLMQLTLHSNQYVAVLPFVILIHAMADYLTLISLPTWFALARPKTRFHQVREREQLFGVDDHDLEFDFYELWGRGEQLKQMQSMGSLASTIAIHQGIGWHKVLNITLTTLGVGMLEPPDDLVLPNSVFGWSLCEIFQVDMSRQFWANRVNRIAECTWIDSRRKSTWPWSAWRSAELASPEELDTNSSLYVHGPPGMVDRDDSDKICGRFAFDPVVFWNCREGFPGTLCTVILNAGPKFTGRFSGGNTGYHMAADCRGITTTTPNIMDQASMYRRSVCLYKQRFTDGPMIIDILNMLHAQHYTGFVSGSTNLRESKPVPGCLPVRYHNSYNGCCSVEELYGYITSATLDSKLLVQTLRYYLPVYTEYLYRKHPDLQINEFLVGTSTNGGYLVNNLRYMFWLLSWQDKKLESYFNNAMMSCVIAKEFKDSYYEDYLLEYKQLTALHHPTEDVCVWSRHFPLQILQRIVEARLVETYPFHGLATDL